MIKFSYLYDGTRGYRFNILGVSGLTRKRLIKSRYGVKCGTTMIGLHIGKRSVYFEHGIPIKRLYNFVGYYIKR